MNNHAAFRFHAAIIEDLYTARLFARVATVPVWPVRVIR